MTQRNRGFEIVSKYENEFVFSQDEYNAHLDELGKDDQPVSVKRTFKMPSRGTKKSACYDIFNNNQSKTIYNIN